MGEFWSIGRDQLHCSGAAQQALHQTARELRDTTFGHKVFVRGVVEVSSYCRQNCGYCAMRRDNHALHRYRLNTDQLLELILHHRPAVITDIDIQAGEDPVAVREIVLPLVRQLRRHTNLGITVCLGTLSPHEFDELRKAGADYCVLKIETGEAEHYRDILAPGTLGQRLNAIRYLASTGWNVSSGIIIGLPRQADEMILHSLELLAGLPLAGSSVSPFIAGSDTPYAKQANGDLEATLNCVALMRLASPHWIIPAVSAMKMVGHDGYARALNAGANLTTLNLTPTECREQYPIYRRDRFIMDEDRVLSAIDRAGCTPSTVSVSEHCRLRAGSALAQ
jgi:biotin synthase